MLNVRPGSCYNDCNFLVVGDCSIALGAVNPTVMLMITAQFIFVGDEDCNFLVVGDNSHDLKSVIIWAMFLMSVTTAK